MLPGAASGERVATSVSATRPPAVSITDTLLRLALATNSLAPSADSSSSLGCSSTSMRPVTRQAAVSITATAAWAHSDT